MNAPILLHLSSGRGPAECAWVLARVLDRMKKQAGALSITTVSDEVGPHSNTLLSAVVEVSGDGAEAWARSWIGSIQWIGASPYRPTHRRKNWFVQVSSTTAVEDFVIDPNHLHYEAIRGSGPGGQHRNKVATGVRLVHAPSGIAIEATDERSQTQNKRAALERLRRQLDDQRQKARSENDGARWREHSDLERGNAVRVFVGSQFKQQMNI